ncbi:MAG: EFR1 family ferrodoxin [Roseburia sp.]|nr:EFR1 family ferrodoxin [Corallococcus sp.]MCM1441128.1 EFR1 family ferrodoxin [Roseburia sp.]
MKILICYFSGTGNTQKVAERFAECFRNEYDATVDVERMENGLNNDVNDYDVVGFGYPVHAFNAPSIVLDFCRKLPVLSSAKRAFIFNTSGEPLKLNNISSLKMQSILKKHRFTVENEFHYCMPYNIIFRHGDRMAYNMWDVAQRLIPLDAELVANNRNNSLDKVFMGRFIAWIMRIEHWGGRFNGRFYKITDNCVNCQMCVKICPVNNITVKGNKLKFGKKCLMCMRCAHLCNKDAIKIGLFNKWKVNGKYSFANPETPNNERYNKMLTKSYKRYFEHCNSRISKAVSEICEREKVVAVETDNHITADDIS